MTLEEEIFQFSKNSYIAVYNSTKDELEKRVLRNSKRRAISKTNVEKIETEAQLNAIKSSFINGREKYPDNVELLWASIYKAHLYRKSGISNPVIVQNAISAEQSWRASSGHAFEYAIKELTQLALHDTEIEFVLQKDLSRLLNNNELSNEERDLIFLREQVRADNFDLFTIAKDKNNAGKFLCFGCVQCKTSIRDRVSRDRELSATAMRCFFWSITFVVDGSMLHGKYIDMVNGNSKEGSTFKQNGWHGMYVFSAKEANDRIYPMIGDFALLRNHTLQAYAAWSRQRQWFTNSWKADVNKNSEEGHV